MKTLDRIVTALILLLGSLHSALSPVFRGHYDGAGMWFLGAGLMMIFLGLLNLVRSASPGATARWAALAANVLGLAFLVALVPAFPLRENPQVATFIVLVVIAILLTLRRRNAPAG